MKKLSQKKRIIGQLKQFGFITRNSCLKNSISRLGSIICNLKSEGYEFETSDMPDGDYKYTWINPKPKEKWEYVERNGERVAVKVLEEPKTQIKNEQI
jgi:hypothetical protein